MRPFNPFDKDGCVCLGCNLPSTAPNSIFTTRSRIYCYIECKLTNNGTKMHQCYYSLIDGSCSRTRTFQILIFGISNPSNSITCSKATNEIFFVLYQRLVKYNENVMLSLEYERLFLWNCIMWLTQYTLNGLVKGCVVLISLTGARRK